VPPVGHATFDDLPISRPRRPVSERAESEFSERVRSMPHIGSARGWDKKPEMLPRSESAAHELVVPDGEWSHGDPQDDRDPRVTTSEYNDLRAAGVEFPELLDDDDLDDELTKLSMRDAGLLDDDEDVLSVRESSELDRYLQAEGIIGGYGVDID
jgi:hypothetical protein